MSEAGGAPLHELTLSRLAELIAARQLSPVELARSLLDRIEAIDPQVNAFITVTADAALAQARRAESEIAGGGWRGPMHGMPFALKDIFDTAGVLTSGHSRICIDNVPARDGFAVAKLQAAGAVLLGKLATHEFAHGGPSFDLPWPPARNPWNLEHITGGSSSGPGAALAAGASVTVGFNATQGLGLGAAGPLTGPALLATTAAQLAAITGNPAYQSGDAAANLLRAGSGADQLTGLAGNDVFQVSSLGQSLLGAVDRITDFAVGADNLDGPTAVAASQVAKLGAVAVLSEAGVATVLTATSFLASKAATFTLGSGPTTRTFVALNDGVSGFQAASDGVLEITGYGGDLRGLAVI